ncbi:MAG: flagellar hook-length control protein FliK [Marinagarivorans sp.]|nr:flagellar hook-length control protein FliK [Marinagarivorans sp.]
MINNPLLQLSNPESPKKIKNPSFERSDNTVQRNAVKPSSTEPDRFKKELNKATKTPDNSSPKKSEAPASTQKSESADKVKNNDLPVAENAAIAINPEINQLPVDDEILTLGDGVVTEVVDASLMPLDFEAQYPMATLDNSNKSEGNFSTSENVLTSDNALVSVNDALDINATLKTELEPLALSVKNDAAIKVGPFIDEVSPDDAPLRYEMPFSLLKMIKTPVTSSPLDLSTMANEGEFSLSSTDNLLTFDDDILMASENTKAADKNSLLNIGLVSPATFSSTTLAQPMAQFAQNLMLGGDNSAAALTGDIVDAATAELDADIAASTLESAVKNAPTVAINKPMVVTTHLRVGMPGWADQIAERTASLVSQNIKQAEIILNPQDMGPIHVKLTVSNDQAAITFVAQNAQVRELLDQSVQRLRESLANDGVDLIQSDVRDQQQFADSQQEQSERDSHNSSLEPESSDVEIKTMVVSQEGIDHFV